MRKIDWGATRERAVRRERGRGGGELVVKSAAETEMEIGRRGVDGDKIQRGHG